MITVEQRAFTRAARVAASVLERGRVPILEQLHCHANGALALTGTDLDMIVETRIDYQGKPRAPFMIGQVRHVLNAVRAAGGAELALEPGDDAALTVRVPDLAIGVKSCAVADDFPVATPVGEPMLAGTLGQREIALLRRVARAMSSEETRYYLNGIFLHQTDDWTMRAVATDGHRLTVADLKLPDLSGDLTGFGDARQNGVIIPRKMIKLMLAELGKVPDVRIEIARSLIPNADVDLAPQASGSPRVSLVSMIDAMRVLMVSKTIGGHFPDYSRVIPPPSGKRIGVKTAALRRVINTLTALYESNRPPAVKFHVAGDELAVSVGYATADARMTVPCTSVGADMFSIGFNGRYLMDILADLPGDDVVFEVTGSAAPVMVLDPSESDIFSILMPMRV